MRFQVRGFWKYSAMPAAVTFAADTERQARDYAASTGIIVVDVSVVPRQPAREDPPRGGGAPHPRPNARPAAPLSC